MTEENNNGTITPAAAPAPAAAVQPVPLTEVKPAAEAPRPIVEGDTLVHEANEESPPSIPTAQPPAGTEYVFDPEDGLWHVRRVRSDDEIAAAIAKAQAERSGDDDEQPAANEAAGKAVAERITVPEILPDSLQHDEASAATVKEVGAILGEVGYTAPAVQRVVDLAAEFFTETNEGHPHLDDKEAVEGLLRVRWGSEHDANLKAVHAASKKLGPKFIAWLETGPGNHVAVIETLAALGRGDFSLGKQAAEAEMAKIRASAPMKDRYHRDHQHALTRYRVLANVAARGEESGAEFEAKVSKVLSDQVKKIARGEALPSREGNAPTADPEARIKQLRADWGKAKSGSPERKALSESIANEYRRLYPGEVSA